MKVGRPWLRGPLVGIGVQAQFHTYTSAFTLNVGHSDTQGLEGTKCLVCLPIPPLRGGNTSSLRWHDGFLHLQRFLGIFELIERPVWWLSAEVGSPDM